MRTFIASLNLLNFLVGIFATGYVLNVFWNHLEAWQTTLYIYYIVLGFCGMAIAYWIIADGKDIEHGLVEIQDLERRILDLEKRIDRVKNERE